MRARITKIMVELEDGSKLQWEGEVGAVHVSQTYRKDDRNKKTYFKSVVATLKLPDEAAPTE